MKPTYEQLEAENKALKEKVHYYQERAVKTEDERKSLALQLVAVRKTLSEIANRVNNEGDDSQACVSDIGHMARTVVATPTPALVTQMEKKMEVAGKMVKVVELLRTMTPANRLTSSEWNRVNEALAIWNEADTILSRRSCK